MLAYAAVAFFKGGRSGEYHTFQDEEQTALKQETAYDPVRSVHSISHASIQPPPPSKYEPVREHSS